MNLLLSFSGGKTSAYMTKWMLENKSNDYDDIKVIFANTGQEDERTLEFVNQCDIEWGLNVIWLEANVIHEERKGTSFKIVDYKTASRNGQPFEEVIKKYGIPNQSYPHCTRELKLQPITAYLRYIGWKKGSYYSAIGIRSDEMDRVSSKMNEQFLIYPLVEYHKVTKDFIRAWWEQQSFNLDLKEHEGNCSWCWKKSKRKLLTLAVDTPSIFNFPNEMELQYGLNGSNKYGTKRVFFRKNTSTQELLKEAMLPFDRFVEKKINFNEFNEDLDSAGGCSESCEIF